MASQICAVSERRYKDWKYFCCNKVMIILFASESFINGGKLNRLINSWPREAFWEFSLRLEELQQNQCRRSLRGQHTKLIF